MSQIKRGVILMNLGSPDSTEVKDVKRYLDEFLMDERVIDSPLWWRTILVKGIITPFRSSKSAEAYHSIWTKDGSPLVFITKQLQGEVQKHTTEPIVIAMRYGNPNMKSAYDELVKHHPDLDEVVLLPLYPHYAMSSYETAVVHAQDTYAKGNYPFEIKVVPAFYKHPAYIKALSESIRNYVTADRYILFSYHSIPVRHIHKSDVTGSHCLKVANCCDVDSPAHKECYKHQCVVTTKLVAQYLSIPENQYSISFQSKLGRAAWLTPATTARMDEMPKEGIKKLAVVCPAFVSDCLETLEEVAIRERENFEKAGGEEYTFIPCMNTQELWVKAVLELINTAV